VSGCAPNPLNGLPWNDSSKIASPRCGIIGRVTSMPLARGTQLGAYEIRAPIGAGGKQLAGAAPLAG